MAARKPRIDTEPDDVFEAVFGPAVDEPFGKAAESLADPDEGGDESIDLDALDLSDEVDEDLWSLADPEFGGVRDRQSGEDPLGLDGGILLDDLDDDPDDEDAAEADDEDGHGPEEGMDRDAEGTVFDAVAAEALRTSWMANLDSGVMGFRLDLTDKAAVDAAGLAFLAAFARELTSAGGALTVAASGQVLEVLSLCGLDRRWPVVLEGERS